MAGCIWKWRRVTASRAAWIPTGKSLGFKSVYSDKVPLHLFPPHAQVKDTLLRERTSDELYVGVWLMETRSLEGGGQGGPDFPGGGEVVFEMIPEATFALFQLKDVYLPAFEIRPRVTVEKLLPWSLESQPDHKKFRRHYALLSPDDDVAGVAGLLPHPFLDRVCELFDYQIRSSARSLLLQRTHRVLDSSDLPEFVRQADALLTALNPNPVGNIDETRSDSISAHRLAFRTNL